MAEALGDEAFLRLGSLLEGDEEILRSATHEDEMMHLNHSGLNEDVGLALLEARVSGKGMRLPHILPREIKIAVRGRGEVMVEGVLPDRHTIGDLKRMGLQAMGYSAREIRSLREGNLTLTVGGNPFPDRFLVGATGLLSDGEIAILELDDHMSSRTLIKSRSYHSRGDSVGTHGPEVMFFNELQGFEKSIPPDEAVDKQDSLLMLLNGYRRVCQELAVHAADSVATGVARMTLSRGMTESSAKLLYTSETLAEELWRQERDTWDLLAVLLECHLEDSLLQGEDEKEKHADMILYHQLHHIKPTSSDDDVVKALSHRDGRYRLNASICSWLERVADENAEVVMGGGEGAPMECTIRRLLRERGSFSVSSSSCLGLTSSNKEAAVQTVGPDATIMRNGSASVTGSTEGKDSLQVCPLSGTDEDDELELMQGVWHLLRAGRWPDAVALCVSRRTFWRAASLSGGHMSWVVDEGGMRLVVKPGGNPRRALWREMCWNLSNGLREGLGGSGGGGGVACYESAIYAVLAGDSKGLLSLPLLHSWEDYAWVLFTAARRRQEDEELIHHHEGQAQMSDLFPSIDTLPSERRILENTTTDKDLTPKEIFSQLSLVPESLSPAAHKQVRRLTYRVRGAAVLKDDALRDLLITVANETTAQYHSSGDESNMLDLVISSETRFAAHLVLFLKQAYPAVCIGLESEQACDSLLAAYVTQLTEQGKVEVASLYASHLSSQRRSEAWLKLMLAIPYKSPKRGVCLTLTRECFPGGNEEAAELARQACRRTLHSSDSEDAICVSGLEWLCLEESMRGAAIAEANALIRALIINPKRSTEDETTRWDIECIAPVRSLLLGNEERNSCGGSHRFCMPSLDESSHVLSVVSQVLLTASEMHVAMREYKGWVAFMRARDAIGEWRKALAKAKMLPARSKLPNGIAKTVTREKEVELLKEKALKANEIEKESKELLIRANVARLTILNVLMFQGGWMIRVDPDALGEEGSGSQKPDDEAEMELLRCRCLPVLLLTLHTVMHDTGKWHALQGLNDPARDWLQEARQVADLAVSTKYGLYRVISPSTAASLLQAIRESSIELLRLE